MAVVRVKPVLGTTPRSPSRGEAPHGSAQTSPIHAYAREGIVTHAEAVLHQMLIHALVFGVAPTCIGVLFYLVLRHYSVRRNGPGPKTANVRVRRGQSYRQALQEEMNRR